MVGAQKKSDKANRQETASGTLRNEQMILIETQAGRK
jgi:hypothetical protein